MAEETTPSASPEQAAPASEQLPGIVSEGVEPSFRAEAAFSAPETAPAAAVAADTAETPAAAQIAEKFVFGGNEFESKDAAEQSFRTLRGMHKSLQRQSEEARLALLEQKQAQQEAAQRLQQMEQELAQYRAGTAKPGQAQAGQKAGGDGEVDWELYEVLHQQHGAAVAQRWLRDEQKRLVDEQVKTAVEGLKSEFSKELEPLKESFERDRQVGEMAGLFQQMKAYTYSDGRPAYPELADVGVMQAIGELWRELDLPREVLSTPKGLHMAIAVYRDAQAQRAGYPANGNGQSTSRVALNPAAAVSSASAVVSTSGDAPVVRRPMSEEDRIKADIRNAAVMVEGFGFSP